MNAFTRVTESPESLNTMPVKDELGIYHVEAPDLPDDVVFPDEVNRYLRDRIKYLTHENGMLAKSLKEKTSKLEQAEMHTKSLEMQLKKENDNVFVSTVELANKRIVELSKKLREITSEMQSYKTKCTKLQKRVIELQQIEEEHKEPKVSSKNEITPNEQEQTIKNLQEKLNAVSSKLFETKNANTLLKNDLKAANKMLQQEVGDSYESLQNSSNWRGRAQIICDLQEKNSELREKLKLLEKGHTSKIIERPSNVKNEKKIENLLQENKNLTQELQEVKKKLDASRSRCKYLDTEMIVMKTKLKAAHEQSERDNDRLTILTGQMAQLQNGQNDNVKMLQKQQQKLEDTIKSLKAELMKEKCLNDNLHRDLSNKEASIDELRHEVEAGLRPNTYINSKKYEKELSRLDTERLRLLELVNVGNKRLEHERNSHNSTQLKYLHERQKAAKLESRIARLQLEQNSDRNSTYSGQSLIKLGGNKSRDENILDRLELAEENLKVISTRLQIEKHEREQDFKDFKKILLDYNGNDND